MRKHDSSEFKIILFKAEYFHHGNSVVRQRQQQHHKFANSRFGRIAIIFADFRSRNYFEICVLRDLYLWLFDHHSRLEFHTRKNLYRKHRQKMERPKRLL